MAGTARPWMGCSAPSLALPWGVVSVSLCILVSLRFGPDLGWTPPYGDSIAASYAQDYTPFETDEFNEARDAFDALSVTPRLP